MRSTSCCFLSQKNQVKASQFCLLGLCGLADHWKPQTLTPHWSHFKFTQMSLYSLSYGYEERQLLFVRGGEASLLFGAHSAVAASASRALFVWKNFLNISAAPPKRIVSQNLNLKVIVSENFQKCHKRLKRQKPDSAVAASASRALFVCHKLFPLHWWSAGYILS